MNTDEFLEQMNHRITITNNSEASLHIHEVAQDALRITSELNKTYHKHSETVRLFSELTGKPVDESFTIFPPFYTEYGKNISVGKRVFINAGCNFQDHGGITIGNDALIGHNVVLATLNHDLNPEHRKNLIPSPIVIGNNAWIGASATILPGVTIGKNSVVAAGAVVTSNIPDNVVAAGIPAKIIRHLDPAEVPTYTSTT